MWDLENVINYSLSFPRCSICYSLLGAPGSSDVLLYGLQNINTVGTYVPGPLAPPENNRPSRKMTALSYSWTTYGVQNERWNGIRYIMSAIVHRICLSYVQPILECGWSVGCTQSLNCRHNSKLQFVRVSPRLCDVIEPHGKIAAARADSNRGSRGWIESDAFTTTTHSHMTCSVNYTEDQYRHPESFSIYPALPFEVLWPK